MEIQSNPNKETSIVFGCGGHGKVVVDAMTGQGLRIDFILDDAPSLEQLFGIPVAASREFLTSVSPGRLVFIVAIGDNRKRRSIYDRLISVGGRPRTVIHKSATLSPTSSIGHGSFVNAGAIVNADTVIGENCIINTAASVDHDCSIGDDCHLGPGVRLSAAITIETGCFIGTGASVIPERRVEKYAVVGAGSVVTRDIPAFSTAYGNPARVQS